MNKKYGLKDEAELERIVQRKLQEDIACVLPDATEIERAEALCMLRAFFPADLRWFTLQRMDLAPYYARAPGGGLGFNACGTRYHELLTGLKRYYLQQSSSPRASYATDRREETITPAE